jgi:ABC-type antimicrobial peptide transport system permease subunit
MNHFESILDELNKIQDNYASNYPFEYEFLDEAYASMYHSEERISELMNYFTLIAIMISCMGLYGLAAYTTERRTKELGIRKVMGASVSGIIGMVSKEYIFLVLLACIIAFPIAWYFMEIWLSDFAFHIELNPFVFILSVVVALFLAISTVSYFALKAARTNPVEVLRYE